MPKLNKLIISHMSYKPAKITLQSRYKKEAVLVSHLLTFVCVCVCVCTSIHLESFICLEQL